MAFSDFTKSKHITIGTGSNFTGECLVRKTNNQPEAYCLCPRLRYLRFPLTSKNGCCASCAPGAMATCWPYIFSCFVRVTRRQARLPEPEPEPLAAMPARASRFSRLVAWLITQPPRVFGWCRTRWSCVALALTIEMRTGLEYSRETVRRELRAQNYVWKRAKLKTRDDDPMRVQRLARIRFTIDHLRPDEALFWVDELDIQLLAKVGYQWMLKGTQLEIPTPGQNEKQYLAGALDWRTGELHYVIGPRKNNVLFRQLLTLLEQSQGRKIKQVYVVADNYKIHKAKAVLAWLEKHTRVEILWLPSYCPKANPIERAFGDVHDKCTRNHTRKKLHWLIWDVK